MFTLEKAKSLVVDAIRKAGIKDCILKSAYTDAFGSAQPDYYFECLTNKGKTTEVFLVPAKGEIRQIRIFDQHLFVLEGMLGAEWKKELIASKIDLNETLE